VLDTDFPELLLVGDMMSATATTFFVPEKISRLPVSALPLSGKLGFALRLLRVKVMADLAGLSLSDLRAVNRDPSKLCFELNQIIERARNGEFSLELDSADRVSIPPKARGVPISAFPLSFRLRNLLGWKGIKLMGDLHGLSYKALAQYRNCGSKTLAEFRRLVQAVQSGRVPLEPRPPAQPAQRQASRAASCPPCRSPRHINAK
jgi:hypothetical protein